MAAEGDALDALKTNEAAASVARLAERVLFAAAEARSWTSGKARAPSPSARSEDAPVADKAQTPFGDAIAVLDRGPEDDAERALARALAAMAASEAATAGRPVERLAGDVLWLAVHTAFDATDLLDAALPEEAAAGLWKELGEVIRKVEDGSAATLGRAEALVAAAALARSTSAAARRTRARLAGSKDAVIARLLAPPPGSAAASAGGVERFSGEVVASPRSAGMTVLMAFTGVLFLTWAMRLIGRLALAYRRPAEVTFEDAAIRIRARTVMLGRVLGEREIVITRGGLARATREVRYPRLAFYAGLLALAVGSYVGVAALVDGTRAASPSLLLAGLIIVAVGIALDVLLGSIAPGVARTCRVAFVPKNGAPVCVGGVAFERADAALALLAAR